MPSSVNIVQELPPSKTLLMAKDVEYEIWVKHHKYNYASGSADRLKCTVLELSHITLCARVCVCLLMGMVIRLAE